MREEQANARITPRQAVPFFFDKFKSLCSYLRRQALSSDLTPTSRYLYARDLAFFSLDFYSGDRASDLGRVRTKQVLSLPDKQGLLFKHTFGKTLRGNDVHTFAVRACSDPAACPVTNLFLYVHLSDAMGINLRDGICFVLPTTKDKSLETPSKVPRWETVFNDT